MFGTPLGIVAASSGIAGAFAACEIGHLFGTFVGLGLWLCGVAAVLWAFAVQRVKNSHRAVVATRAVTPGSPPRSIVISHMSSDENLGDYAILHAIATELTARCCPERITVLSAEIPQGSPFDPEEVHRMEALGVEVLGTPVPSAARSGGGRMAWAVRLLLAELALACVRVGQRRLAEQLLGDAFRATILRIEQADLVVAKGGSYLFGGRGVRDRIFVWRMTYHLRLCAALGKPAIPFGVSVGPLPLLSARQVAAALKPSPKIYVREALSRDYLTNRLGIDRARIVEIPDPALGLGLITEATDRPAPSEATHDGIAFTVRELLTLVARPTARSRESFRAALAICARDLAQKHRIAFVVQVREDARLSEAIAAEVPGATVVDATALADLNDVIALYGSFSVLVGTRLHSVLLAAVAGTPAIHLAYERHKGLGLMRTLGATAWMRPVEEVEALDLSQLVEDAVAQRSELSLQLRLRLAQASADLGDAYDALCGVLATSGEARGGLPLRRSADSGAASLAGS
jgi:colanic acid/amylovoran biosynthesis protein